VDVLPENVPLKQKPLWEEDEATHGDPLLMTPLILSGAKPRLVSMLQRKDAHWLYARCAFDDVMEDRGIVGPRRENTQVRQVLDYGPTAPPKDE